MTSNINLINHLFNDLPFISYACFLYKSTNIWHICCEFCNLHFWILSIFGDFVSILQQISCIHCPSFHFLKMIFRLRKFFLLNFILKIVMSCYSSMSKKAQSLLLFLDIFVFLCPKFGWKNTLCPPVTKSIFGANVFKFFFQIFFFHFFSNFFFVEKCCSAQFFLHVFDACYCVVIT